jgi:tRNA pseudouridine(38-40) synthase
VFAPPLEGTQYNYPEQESDDEDDDFTYPTEEGQESSFEKPAGGLFQTLKRSLSMKQKQEPPAPTADEQTLVESGAAASSEHHRHHHHEDLPRKKNVFARFWSNLMFGKNVPEKIRKRQEAEKQAIKTGATLNRQKSLKKEVAPPPPVEKTEALQVPSASSGREKEAQMASSPMLHEEDAFSGMHGLMSTLKRSLSRRRPRGEFNDESDGPVPSSQEEKITYHEPLDIPWTDAYLDQLKAYRMSEAQVKAVEFILSIYNGTHNWHNYIPGASPDDPRCYLRILNIELGQPEMKGDMEWIRIKVQAKAFARLQVRKMMAFAIMVARTNTPRSVVANSFGYAKIVLPETPAYGLILDEPLYKDYNEYAATLARSPIEFDSIHVSYSPFIRSLSGIEIILILHFPSK